MSGFWRVTFSAIVLVTLSAAPTRAEDVSASKMIIKDNAKPEKRQVQVQSKDAGVARAGAEDPATNGASLHMYSATDDLCIVLPPGADWKDTGKLWKYKSKTTKNQAQIADGKLKVKIKTGVTYSLLDNETQGTVNAQVQFGNGTRYCMQCTGNKKDEAKKFIAKNCAAAACAAEPSVCDPSVTTTTTTSTTTSTSTTTTTLQAPGIVLQGVLPATTGRFNYNLAIGVPGSDSACNFNFPGSHTCTFPELQAAEAAGDLVGRKAINGTTVASFWAIDATHANTVQCTVSIAWDYQTAHTGQFAELTNLDNPTGTLGPVMGGVCASMSWVGCCL
jgi:hypothetical protein